MNWNDENIELVTVNGDCVSTSTVNFYIPISGSTTESGSTAGDAVLYIPNRKMGRVNSINIIPSTEMGITIITIYDRGVGGVIGSKTVTLGTGLNKVDFTTGMDSGTNEFDGTGPILIGLNPATGGNTILYSIIFERNLF